MKKKMPSKKQLESDIRTMTQQEIADEYGVTLSTVGRWLRNYNLHKKNNNAEANIREMTEAEKEEPEATLMTPEEFQKQFDDAQDLFDKDVKFYPLYDIVVAGIEVQPESNDIIKHDDDIVADAIRRNFVPDFTTSNFIYHVKPTIFYVIFNEQDKKNIINALRDMQKGLSDNHGVDMIFNVRSGENYTSVENMMSDINTQLLRMNRGISFRDYVFMDVQEMASHLYSHIEVDPSLLKNLPETDDETMIKDPAGGMTDETAVGAADSKEKPEKNADSPADTDGSAEEQDSVSNDINDKAETPAEEAVPVQADNTEGNISALPEVTDVSDVYLIDSENVNASWKKLLDGDPAKKFIVMYTDNTPKISYEDMAVILTHPGNITFEKVFPGERASSALDFQLVSILGFLLHDEPNKTYTVVSRDSGYDPVIKYWSTKGYSVRRFTMVNRDLPEGTDMYDAGGEADFVEKHDTTPQEKPDSVGKKCDKILFLKGIIPGKKNSIYEKMISILDTESATGKIYADFMDIFGAAQGRKMYNSIKKYIDDYKTI